MKGCKLKSEDFVGKGRALNRIEASFVLDGTRRSRRKIFFELILSGASLRDDSKSLDLPRSVCKVKFCFKTCSKHPISPKNSIKNNFSITFLLKKIIDFKTFKCHQVNVKNSLRKKNPTIKPHSLYHNEKLINLQ